MFRWWLLAVLITDAKNAVENKNLRAVGEEYPRSDHKGLCSEGCVVAPSPPSTCHSGCNQVPIKPEVVTTVISIVNAGGIQVGGIQGGGIQGGGAQIGGIQGGGAQMGGAQGGGAQPGGVQGGGAQVGGIQGGGAQVGGIQGGGAQVGGIQGGGGQIGGVQGGGVQIGGQTQGGGVQIGGTQPGGIQGGETQPGGIQVGGVPNPMTTTSGGTQVGGVTNSMTTNSEGTQGGTNSSGQTGGSASTTSSQNSTQSAIEGTTTVDLATSRNTTIFLNGYTSPSASPTPVPAPTDLGDLDATYDFLRFKSNATNYNLGGLIPITTNGTAWLPGVQYVEAFKCQLNILNSNKRILPASFITYTIQNTDITAANSTYQAFLLERQNNFMVVGPAYNDQIPSVGYLYGPQNLSFVSFDASSVDLANSTVFPSFFRTIPSDTFQARAMAEMMRIFNWNFVAALFTTDSYGQSGRTAFLSQTGRQRIKVTCTNSINPGSVSGLSSFADCVAQSSASVVLLWMDELNAANALSFLYRNATNTRLTFIASDRWALIKDPIAFNTSVVARTNTSFPLSFLNGTLGFVPQIGQLGQYRACVSQLDPSKADYPEFTEVWEESFRCRWDDEGDVPDCPPEIENRREECRCTGQENFADLPIDRLVNYVQDTVNILYQALNSLFIPSQCQKLKAPSLCNRTTFTPSMFVDSLSKVSIPGLTGTIQFNVTQPDRRRANFDIYQYRVDGIPEQVGFWNITGPFLGQNLLGFKTSPAYPVSILDPDNTNFGNGFWPTLVAVVAGIGIALALALIAFFALFMGSRVVRRTNFLWLLTIYAGIIAVLTSLIMWTFRQSTFICSAKSVLGMLGFGLITACIVVKTQRIFRVLINQGNVSMVLRTTEFLLVAGLVLIPDIMLIIIYLIGSGSLPTATITQSTLDNTYLYITCTPSSQSFNNWVVACFIAYNLLLVIISAVVLLLSRHLQTAYSEAEFLFLCLVDFILLCAIMIPLYYTVGDRRGSELQSFLLRSLAVLFAMILTMALLAFPKVNAIMAGRKAKKQREAGQPGSASYGVVPVTEESDGSLSDFTSVSSTGKPRFISQTETHRSMASASKPQSTGNSADITGTLSRGDSTGSYNINPSRQTGSSKSFTGTT